jgi:formylglycine-generating enzyme required for sulfatase activity
MRTKLGIVSLLCVALGAALGCAAEAPKNLTIYLGSSATMKLVLIEPGTFLMGSPKDEAGRYDDETPHPVTIGAPFYLGTTAVTVDQYAQFAQETGRWHVPPRFPQTGDQPVVNVSWQDAYEFCDWLTWKTGLMVSLPSEAQWEYSCRAGTGTAYNSGESVQALAEAAWYKGNSGGRPHSAGQKTPNAWGLYDMHGNVWQWCADWYGSYPATGRTDPGGPERGGAHVLRGGAWSADPRLCRSAYRGQASTGYMSDNLGFRVVVGVDGP